EAEKRAPPPGTIAPDDGQILWRGMPLSRKRIVELSKGYARRLLLALALLTQDRGEAERVNRLCKEGLRPAVDCREQVGFSREVLALPRTNSVGEVEEDFGPGWAPQPLLLMDEPFDGFDLRQTRDIMNVLREVAGAGRTLVLAIHQLRDAARVCDRFVLLAEGRVRGVGTLAQLQAQAGKPAADLEDVFLALT